jgi:hypothetical protein
MLAAIDGCLKALDGLQSQQWPDRIRSRIAEDAGPIRYAADTLHFFDVLVRAQRLVQADRRAEAKALLPEMQRLAKALEADTTSTKWSSSHASAANGLEASLVKKAYERVVSELGN